MDFINQPIAWVLKLCYSFTFNYALALFVFAIFVKAILLPLGVMQHKNSLKQATIRPLEAAVVKKYKGRNDRYSQQKRQQEIAEIQQRAGYSQLKGCLPLLIQLPFVIIIYNIIRKPLTYLCGFTADVVTVIKQTAVGVMGLDAATDIATLDEIAVLSSMRANPAVYEALNGSIKIDALPNFNLFGSFLDLSQTPKGGSAVLLLIPVLTFALTYVTSKLTRKLTYQSPMMQQGGADAKLSLTIMDLMMPALSTWIAYTVPGVIGVYWMFQSILGVLQQFVMVKLMPYPVFTEEDYKEAERALLGKKKKLKTGRGEKNKDPDRPRVRSLHRIDDEEYNSHVVCEVKEAEAPVATESKLIAPQKMKDYDSDKK